MRIVFVIDNTYPNGKASSARVREYGKGFVSNGVETIVIMPQPRILANSVDPNPEGSGTDRNGVKYIAMAGSQKRVGNVVLRQIIDVRGKIITLLWLLFHLQKDDKVIVYEGKNNWISLLQNVCRIKSVEIGLELNELPWVCEKKDVARIRKRNKMLNDIFPKFDFILCISQPLFDLARKYAPKAKLIKVPIMTEGVLECKDILHETKPFVFHSGTLYEQKDGICGMLEAFGMAVRTIGDDINYILTGDLTDSPHLDEINDILLRYDIKSQVKFIGYVDESTLRKYQKHCLLAIINKKDTLQNKYCFSTKLSEYLSFSRPIITTSIGEANAYLRDGVNAFVVNPDRPDLIAEKIVYVYNNPDVAKKIGEEGHKLAIEEFDCVHQTKRIINALLAKEK